MTIPLPPAKWSLAERAKWSMGHRKVRISPHFFAYEFDCRDGTPYPAQWIDDRLVGLLRSLECLRDTIGAPIIINSAYRTKSYNQRIGGVANSLHCQGLAVDIWTKPMTSLSLAALIESLMGHQKLPNGGLGIYNGFVHYDHRGSIGMSPARWDKRMA